jgi:molybdopterin molybdotransferase
MAQLSDDCFAFGGKLMSVDEAIELIKRTLVPAVGTERVPVSAADGRVLAADVLAPQPLPPFDNSAVDGWAVAFADLNPDGETRLPIEGRIAAGGSSQGIEVAGRAVRVFTGAPIPKGSDTIFMQEDARWDDTHVTLPHGLRRWSNMRRAGEDVTVGSVLLPAGRRLRPQDLALAAAVGQVELPVRGRLRVAIFSTGDELQEPGSPLPANATYDSNRTLLQALMQRDGVTVLDLGIIRDDPNSLRERLIEAAHTCDLIVTTGGVSTGEEDHVKTAVEAAGRLFFWRIGIKPGRPVAMGVVKGTPFLGLPGNPVAAFVTYCCVVRPVMACLSGANAEFPHTSPVRMGFDYRKKLGRREFVRVHLARLADGSTEARLFPKSGAGILTSLTDADGMLVLPEDEADIKAGAMMPFLAYEMLL